MSSVLRRHAGPWGLGILGLLSLFGLWWLLLEVFSSGEGLVALFTPQATLASLVELLQRPELFEHVLVSLKRIVIGLGWRC